MQGYNVYGGFVPIPNRERRDPTVLPDPPELYKRRLRNGKLFNPITFAVDKELGGMNTRYMHKNLMFGKLTQKDVRGHTGCVNSVELSRDENWLVSGGDDTRVFVWRTCDMMTAAKPKPVAIMEARHFENVFATEFSLDMEHVFSGGKDGMLMKHNIETKQMLNRDSVREIHQIRQHPVDQNLISVSHSSGISTYDSRSMDRNLIAGKNRTSRDHYMCAEFHPIEPVYLLTCTERKGPLVYDLRNSRRPFLDTEDFSQVLFEPIRDRGMYATWNSRGTGIAALFADKPPVYYDVQKHFRTLNDEMYVEKISMRDNGYLNNTTIKTLCFINDDVIAAGSDDCHIYMWNIIRYPDEERDAERISLEEFLKEKHDKADRILVGHRSIPNQIRFSKLNNLIISSGVENSIKLWSSLKLPMSYDQPFIRRKRRQYQDPSEEDRNEKRQRQELEKRLGDEMEGRATWDDVFGGDPLTAESRVTCEQFDEHMRRSPDFIQFQLDEDERDQQIIAERIVLRNHRIEGDINEFWNHLVGLDNQYAYVTSDSDQDDDDDENANVDQDEAGDADADDAEDADAEDDEDADADDADDDDDPEEDEDDIEGDDEDESDDSDSSGHVEIRRHIIAHLLDDFDEVSD